MTSRNDIFLIDGVPKTGWFLHKFAADPIENPRSMPSSMYSSLDSTGEAPMTVDMSACVCISVISRA